MNKRRELLKSSARAIGGIILVGCGVLDHQRPAMAAAPAPTRRT
jgi:hypothetical protein